MAAETQQAIIEVDDLSFTMLPGTPDVLQGITLSLPPGARCVAVGPNGCGKSTLLEVLAGAKMAPGGKVKVCGQDPFRTNTGQKVALLRRSVADSGLGEGRAAFMRVWQFLGLTDPAAAAAADAGELGEEGQRIERLHKALDLSGLLLRYCGSLSDGEKRKVELASKLKEPREIVLLDEATSDLDLLARQAILGFLKGEGVTIINMTHIFDGMEAWATHLLHMDQGKVAHLVELAAHSPPVWETSGGLFALVANWLAEAGGEVAAMSTMPPVGGVGEDELSVPAVEVKDLSFSYAPWSPVAARLDSLSLPRGSRCVVVGANGSGKSTLLSVIAGRRLVAAGDVRVLGLRSFHDHVAMDAQVTMLSTEWKRQVAEISSGRMLTFRELANTAMQELVAAGLDMPMLAGRMVRLIQMLGVDPTKPLGACSDGMMRRVQIALKLLRPAKVVLVDEVTADLDVLGRQALLTFLKEESEAGCAVMFCTHILDGLDGWASHMLRMRPAGHSGELLDIEDASVFNGTLSESVLRLLIEDATLKPVPVESPAVAPETTAASAEAELPFGWSSRQTSQAGAFGNYGWNADKGAEDTWSFGSVAPNPGVMPTAGGSTSSESAGIRPGGANILGPSMMPTQSGDSCPFGSDRHQSVDALISQGKIQAEGQRPQR